MFHCALEQVLDTDDLEDQDSKVARWQHGKKAEYKTAGIAGAVVASAVTGSLQWSNATEAHWLVRATWDGSLIFSLFCVIIAFHLSIVINTADIRVGGKKELMESLRGDSQSSSSKFGLFIFQTPILLLSYSIMSYLIGLTLLVVSPLWNHPSVDEMQIASTFIPRPPTAPATRASGMGDLKTRLSTLLRRRSSNSSKTLGSLKSTASSGEPPAALPHPPNRRSSSLKLPDVSTNAVEHDDDAHNLEHSGTLSARSQPSPASDVGRGTDSLKSKDRPTLADSIAEEAPAADAHPPVAPGLPAVTLEEPTPIPIPAQSASLKTNQLQLEDAETLGSDVATPLRSRAPKGTKSHQLEPPAIVRRQSLVTTSNARIIKTLLDSEHQPESASIALGPASQDYFAAGNSTFSAGMLHRKVWVKRAHASATLVQVREDDLVDDVREMILKKYANSLGRNFDAPDVTLRIFPRDATQKSGDRVLGPDEEMCRTIDAYYPGGQTVNEALIIDVPHKRTPRPSPRAVQQGIPYYYDQSNPIENAAEYFPPMPVVNPSPAALTNASHDSRASMSHVPQQHSISILNTGQLPLIPSPGGTRRGHHSLRPKYPRQNTASPTTMPNSTASLSSSARTNNRPRHDSTASEAKHPAHAIVPISTPPAAEGAPLIKQGSSPPTPRVSSPRPKGRKKKGTGLDTPSLPSGLLDGSVPPINVLIVEDNIINLRVLGAFMERLKVRWQRAMNGREAVTKWRSGGFHLVLMDIQLPIMNGLEATKEIRRLERVNSIGVFSSGNHVAPNLGEEKEIPAEDKLADGLLFKSPVIIVALTASSLQSDRHEALAAGCNDFLTKPVNFVWLERKVKEWGCMQALIDFDGWRKWKDFAAQSDNSKSTSKLTSSFSINTSKKSKAGSNLSPNSAGNLANGVNGSSPATAAAAAASKAKKKEEDKKKRDSIGMGGPVVEEKESESPSPLDSSGDLT
ncbi:uncharacterized protein BDZ99DRAFT_522798 [Mytilinidion resinicola]|uniref:Response regulatory domain-containing protein n=1 Tax=Mytilinidion resinicola TaxID=574789 RepID=A0A6A6YF62_9PEZI|nr:uncharacterized protein BDZ99DRAFT_522798 [Mytilinidion resinicola]KAF2807173.1 hypothetical protein BDZ99DRAFT_522798 [Mytilinidion resinicola]